jgi:hypothetical protein
MSSCKDPTARLFRLILRTAPVPVSTSKEERSLREINDGKSIVAWLIQTGCAQARDSVSVQFLSNPHYGSSDQCLLQSCWLQTIKCFAQTRRYADGGLV